MEIARLDHVDLGLDRSRTGRRVLASVDHQQMRTGEKLEDLQIIREALRDDKLPRRIQWLIVGALAVLNCSLLFLLLLISGLR
jgi:hypothetical protein